MAEFSPAVLDYALQRSPEWFVLKYVSGREGLLVRLLEFVKLRFRCLTYTQRSRRHPKPVERCWLPGYIFVEFCKQRDNWGQVLRMPYALEFLGEPTPLPPGVVEDLETRLPGRLAKPSAISCVAPGTRVRLRKGAFQDHEGPVTWSDRRRVKAMLMIFGCPREVEIDVRDVEIV